jgi:hypothetical protein
LRRSSADPTVGTASAVLPSLALERWHLDVPAPASAELDQADAFQDGL